jgi:hypothetical protein
MEPIRLIMKASTQIISRTMAFQCTTDNKVHLSAEQRQVLELLAGVPALKQSVYHHS